MLNLFLFGLVLFLQMKFSFASISQRCSVVGCTQQIFTLRSIDFYFLKWCARHLFPFFYFNFWLAGWFEFSVQLYSLFLLQSLLVSASLNSDIWNFYYGIWWQCQNCGDEYDDITCNGINGTDEALETSTHHHFSCLSLL